MAWWTKCSRRVEAYPTDPDMTAHELFGDIEAIERSFGDGAIQLVARNRRGDGTHVVAVKPVNREIVERLWGPICLYQDDVCPLSDAGCVMKEKPPPLSGESGGG